MFRLPLFLVSLLALAASGSAAAEAPLIPGGPGSLYRHGVGLRDGGLPPAEKKVVLSTPKPRRIVPITPPRPRIVAAPVAALHEQATTFTPYDRWSGEVRTVVARLRPREQSLDQVRALMRIGHAFTYRQTHPLSANLPAVTAARRSGDCKSKSLWLADQLGDVSVRYVIGLARQTSTLRHAWLYWNDGAEWWILDCTNTREPIRARDVADDRYIPYYSYAKDGEFRYRATALLLADASEAPNVAVAARR